MVRSWRWTAGPEIREFDFAVNRISAARRWPPSTVAAVESLSAARLCLGKD